MNEEIQNAIASLRREMAEGDAKNSAKCDGVLQVLAAAQGEIRHLHCRIDALQTLVPVAIFPDGASNALEKRVMWLALLDATVKKLRDDDLMRINAISAPLAAHMDTRGPDEMDAVHGG